MPLFCALICVKAVKAKSRPIVNFVTFFIYMLYYFSRDAAYREKNEDIKKGCRLLFFQMSTPKAIGALTDYRFSYSEKAVAGYESRVCVMFMGAKVSQTFLCPFSPFNLSGRALFQSHFHDKSRASRLYWRSENFNKYSAPADAFLLSDKRKNGKQILLQTKEKSF